MSDDPISEENDPLCDDCGGSLVDPEDILEGLHFLCGDFLDDVDLEDEEEMEDERAEIDEGGESGC